MLISFSLPFISQLRIWPLLGLVGLLLGCEPAKNTPGSFRLPSAVFPHEVWLRKTPAELGVDSTLLQQSLDYLATHCKEDGLKETLVIRNGYVIWAGDSTNKVHDIWSCTKSFTSIAAGMLIAENKLTLDSKAATYEPQLNEQYSEVTIEHFLTMTSGYNAAGQSRWNEPSEDWSHTPYVPDSPLFEPGTAYTYWDEAMIMFGRVLTVAAGESLNDFLTPRLFKPLGIQRQEWWGEGTVSVPELNEKTGTNTSTEVAINFGGTGLRMSANEQARFGLLMLNKGNWNGQQLIDSTYIEAALSNQVPKNLTLADTDRKNTDGRGSYGYNWWVIEKDVDNPVAAAYTSGLNHNVCLVIPDWNMVIVRMGVDGNPEAGKAVVYRELLRKLEGSLFVQ